MTVRLLRLALIGVSVILAQLVFAYTAEPDAPKEEPETKQADDPLPPGAKMRFGVSRPILRTNPGVGLVAPGYTTMLAPTMTGGIRAYDVKTGQPLEKQGIVGPGQVVVSADGKRAAVARPGALTVVDVATGKLILAVEPPEGILVVGTPGVALSADGKVLAYGARGRDNKTAAVVLDVDNGEVLAKVATDTAGPVFPELSRDGKTLVTLGPPLPSANLATAQPGIIKIAPPAEDRADTARTAQVWEVAGGKELFRARVSGMGGSVVAGAFSTDGTRLAISAGDGPIDVWEVKTGQRLQTLLGRKGQGARLAFSPDDKTLASSGRDNSIQRWRDGKPLEDIRATHNVPIAPITRLMFADNERVIAWMTHYNFAFVWEATAQTLLSPEMIHQAGIYSIAMPAEEKYLITSGMDAKVFTWDPQTGMPNLETVFTPVHLPGQPLSKQILAVSADGKLAVAPHYPVPEVFDLTTGSSQYVVPLPSAPQARVSISPSPDGTKLVSVSRQTDKKRLGACVVWDLANRQLLGEFEAEPSGALEPPTAVLSPDGTRVALATVRNNMGKASLLFVGYDLKTGKKLAEIEEPVQIGGQIFIVAADSEWLVVASIAGRVWKVNYAKGEIGKDLVNVPMHGEPPIHGPIVFSPDGKRFSIGVVSEEYKTYGVRVYDWPQCKLLGTFMGHRGPLTAQRFSSDGKFLATGSHDTSVLLWDLSKPGGQEQESPDNPK